MAVPEKITFRLGDLARPLGEWCDANGKTPSEASRMAVAAMLGVDTPDMPEGNPDASRETAIAANAARWKKKTKPARKKRK